MHEHHILDEETRKPYKCEDCGDRFVYPYQLEEHIIVKHTRKPSIIGAGIDIGTVSFSCFHFCELSFTDWCQVLR